MNPFTCLKKMVPAGLFLAAALTIPAAPLFAEPPAPTGEVSVSALNRYVWRGYELSRNSMVVQPAITVGYRGFAAGLWGNLDTRPYAPGADAHAGSWNETDLTLSYVRSLGLLNVGVGYIYYSLAPLNRDAAGRNDSQEIFATVSLNTLLSPTLTVYKEIDHYRNGYVLFGLSHVFELTPAVSLKLGATAAYLWSTDPDTYPKFDGDALATTEKFSNFHDGTLSVGLPVKVTDRVTLTPSLSYVFPLSGDAKHEMKGLGLKGCPPSDRDSAFWVWGIAAGFGF